MDEVTKISITSGAYAAARKLGVSYNHMWRVLTGRVQSPGLVLKIERIYPSLLVSPICRIDWRGIVKKNRDRYEWRGSKYALRRTRSDAHRN